MNTVLQKPKKGLRRWGWVRLPAGILLILLGSGLGPAVSWSLWLGIIVLGYMLIKAFKESIKFRPIMIGGVSNHARSFWADRYWIYGPPTHALRFRAVLVALALTGALYLIPREFAVAYALAQLINLGFWGSAIATVLIFVAWLVTRLGHMLAN